MTTPNIEFKTVPDFDFVKECYGASFKQWYETTDKGLYYHLRAWAYDLALRTGDQSFAGKGLAEVQRRLLDGVPLDELDQWFLAMVISRIGDSPVAINAVCDVQDKRGASKRGYRGWGVAHKVMRELQRGVSAEDAWANVAESEHVSVSMVKKSWGAWKDEVYEFDAMESYFREHPEAGQSKG